MRRRALTAASAAIAAFVLSVVGAPSADAMCVPGSLTLLPKPHFDPPRCETHP